MYQFRQRSVHHGLSRFCQLRRYLVGRPLTVSPVYGDKAVIGDCDGHLVHPSQTMSRAQPCSSNGTVTMKASRVISASLVVIGILPEFKTVWLKFAMVCCAFTAQKDFFRALLTLDSAVEKFNIPVR